MIEKITKRINDLLSMQERVVVAIDGDAAAGKSTLAERLRAIYDCSVVRMDHFFLPPNSHTDAPAGNIDFNRLADDVFNPLAAGADFGYQPFDCRTQSFDEAIPCSSKGIIIVEGAYSLYPDLVKHYDLTIFLAIDSEVQLKRILKRNGEAQLQHFINKWIPKEKFYQNALDVKNRCDLVFDCTI